MTTDQATTASAMDSSRALWLGIGFSLLFTLVIWAVGDFWMNPDRYELFSPRKTAAVLPKMWYLWQLNEPTVWTRLTAWGGYIAHNLVIWYLIWKAQSANSTYSSKLHWFNVLALLANAFFICLHLVQTFFWYDGLAQDVSEFTSQASVTLVLVAILILENDRRGMFFGTKAPMLQEAGRTIRKYHGYYFSWAIIYTFWYHPIEITLGHLMGTFYILLLLLQGSLFFTRSHINRWWTLLMEAFVIIHAFMVAYVTHAEEQGAETAARFIFGFGAIFIVTQMYGVNFRNWQRWLFAALFIAGMVWFYAGRWGLALDLLRVPIIDYVLVFVSAGLVWLLFLLPAKLLKHKPVNG